MERAARIGQLFFADENDKWAFIDVSKDSCHCEEGEARRGNPLQVSGMYRFMVLRGPLEGIATPVCALARNDIRYSIHIDKLRFTAAAVYGKFQRRWT